VRVVVSQIEGLQASEYVQALEPQAEQNVAMGVWLQDPSVLHLSLVQGSKSSQVMGVYWHPWTGSQEAVSQLERATQVVIEGLWQTPALQ
jgi:hypothetical protein